MLLFLPSLLMCALFAPLLASLCVGLIGRFLKPVFTSVLSVSLLSLSFFASLGVLYFFCQESRSPFVFPLYHIAVIDSLDFSLGFLIDRLTAVMMGVVTFVSLLVHLYSTVYMKGDSGYSRFFSYISGFTFSMLILVMAHDFLLLFFGWEGVGLFSYLLIGFWFHRDAANLASLKAFLVNRVGDIGLLLGIALVLCHFGSLDYETVFALAPHVAQVSISLAGYSISVITLIAVLLFVGVAGKSAQIPLHVWLEGSMEGPTPISALIHAATMVTAGVFLLARLSPLFEYSPFALSLVLMVGAITCFSMACLGLVQNDIKRVIAYSTLSQLGYMVAAAGASAYSVSIFHLITHASFKALLFLSAGSVILALHHEQDLRNMGGLARKMPITYVCMLVGALALTGLPPFSGFFSKDLIIEAVRNASVSGHSLAFFLLTLATFVTALYTFRLFFMVFHGRPRMTPEVFCQVRECPWPITLPLILLALPSLLLGGFFFQADLNHFFADSIQVFAVHPAMSFLEVNNRGIGYFILENLFAWPCVLGVLGIFLAYFCYVRHPGLPRLVSQKALFWNHLLRNKYYIDALYHLLFVSSARWLGLIFYRIIDVLLIDRLIVGGTAFFFRSLGHRFKKWQSGQINAYAFSMVLGLVSLFCLLAFNSNHWGWA